MQSHFTEEGMVGRAVVKEERRKGHE